MRLLNVLRALREARPQNAPRLQYALLIFALTISHFSPAHSGDFEECGYLLMESPSLPACHRLVQGDYPGDLKAVAHVNLAVDYFKRRDHDRAIEEYTHAIRLTSDSASRGLFFSYRAGALAFTGRIDAAITDLDHASLLNPEGAVAYRKRREALMRQRQPERQVQEDHPRNKMGCVVGAEKWDTSAGKCVPLEQRSEREERRQEDHDRRPGQASPCRDISDAATCAAHVECTWHKNFFKPDSSHCRFKPKGKMQARTKENVPEPAERASEQEIITPAEPRTPTQTHPTAEPPAKHASPAEQPVTRAPDPPPTAGSTGYGDLLTKLFAKAYEDVRSFRPGPITLVLSLMGAGGLGFLAAFAVLRGRYSAVSAPAPADALEAPSKASRLQPLVDGIRRIASQAVNNPRQWLIETMLKIQRSFSGYIVVPLRALLPQPVPLPPEERDRQVQSALRYAHELLEKWAASKNTQEKEGYVRSAAEWIEKVKALDIHATYSFIGDDKQPETWDLKQFSGTALFYEAQNHITLRRYAKATRALHRALEFEPDTTQYQNVLAEAYIKWGRRGAAKHILKNVKYPDLRTEEFRAKIKRQWMLGRLFITPWTGAMLGCVAFAYAAYYFFDKEQWWNWTPFILAGISWACWWTAGQISIEDEMKRKGTWKGRKGSHEL